MKRIIVLNLALAILAALLLPAAVNASGDHGGNRDDFSNNIQKYAILVGISDYPGPLNVLQGGLDLFYADDDAYAMRTALICHGFSPSNIHVLKNRQATREKILDQIRDVCSEAGPSDEVVFYFSGHSIIPDAPPSDPVYGLWPTSAPRSSNVGILVWGDSGQTAIVFDRELRQEFWAFRTHHIVFGFDSCWAGRFAEVAGNGRVVVMASGSTPEAIAAEYGEAYASFGVGPLPGIGWMNQGLFTYFFGVQGLTQGMATDLNGDGVVSVEEAFAYAQNILIYLTDLFKSYGVNEIPVMIDSSGGDFHL
jgi:hypothetical protein